jgi:hypothetical protein
MRKPKKALWSEKQVMQMEVYGETSWKFYHLEEQFHDMVLL